VLYQKASALSLGYSAAKEVKSAMRNLLLKFWRDDCGAVGPEWACIMTVLVLGSVAALMAAQQTLVRDVTKAVEIVAAD
jgi:Flp pilus assembly pilin Flp